MLAGAYDGAAHGTANNVELWNGTCWSNSPYDLNTARYNPLGTAGTQTAAKEEMNNIMGTETANMSIGGIGGPGNSTVFEYTGPGVSTQTITVT